MKSQHPVPVTGRRFGYVGQMILVALCALWFVGCTTQGAPADAATSNSPNSTSTGDTQPAALPATPTEKLSSDAASTEGATPAVEKTPGAGGPPVPDDTATLPDSPPIRYTYEVVATFPHDANAFTQGLLFDGDTLYEGTGLYGESTLRRVALETGTVEQQVALPAEYFGEGIALIDDRIYQLTWREQTGFIYDKTTFEQIGEFAYATEGWGLTYDGTNLILSDGSERLYTIDPDSMQVVDQVSVTYFDGVDQQRKPVVRLNELEYINGTIFANVWQTNYIVQIAPETGNVTGMIDFTGLLPEEEYTAATDVLNGIAYRPATDQLYVTGKKWPKLFEIRLIEEQ